MHDLQVLYTASEASLVDTKLHIICYIQIYACPVGINYTYEMENVFSSTFYFYYISNIGILRRVVMILVWQSIWSKLFLYRPRVYYDN